MEFKNTPIYKNNKMKLHIDTKDWIEREVYGKGRWSNSNNLSRHIKLKFKDRRGGEKKKIFNVRIILDLEKKNEKK